MGTFVKRTGIRWAKVVTFSVGVKTNENKLSCTLAQNIRRTVVQQPQTTTQNTTMDTQINQNPDPTMAACLNRYTIIITHQFIHPR